MMNRFFQAIKEALDDIDVESDASEVEEGEEEGKISLEVIADNDEYELINNKIPNSTYSFNLNDSNYFVSEKSYEFNFWCKKISSFENKELLEDFIKLENNKVVKKIVSYKEVALNEIEIYENLNKLHYMQLIWPSVGVNKEEWVHQAIKLANSHLEINFATKNISFSEKVANSIMKSMKDSRLKKISLISN
ncbi:hypothetical protein K502DRAFT_97538 [Neoconidiobolus thromboides FSU 785]|nr:hypothetical protein K502DRAFT_97538 [Neoconidiobolus thromboides FSU 785]